MLGVKSLLEDGVNEESGSEGKVKVVDRRWFTQDGDLREDRPRTAAAPKAEGADPKAAGQAHKDPPPSAPPEPPQAPREAEEIPITSTLFLELLETLAQQAQLLLAGGQGLPKQPEQARRLIDYIGVLESKTKGNLSLEESQILSNVLFQLRSVFVQYTT
jgi:hypothetical protein